MDACSVFIPLLLIIICDCNEEVVADSRDNPIATHRDQRVHEVAVDLETEIPGAAAVLAQFADHSGEPPVQDHNLHRHEDQIHEEYLE